MATKPSKTRPQSKTTVGRAALGIGIVALAFWSGIQSAGELPLKQASQAAKPLQAQLVKTQQGDFDGDGLLTTKDVIGILEVEQKLTTPTRAQIQSGDTDGDGVLTVKDALRILRALSGQ